MRVSDVSKGIKKLVDLMARMYVFFAQSVAIVIVDMPIVADGIVIFILSLSSLSSLPSTYFNAIVAPLPSHYNVVNRTASPPNRRLILTVVSMFTR